ncbi:MAG: tripartite tricarboxylate transporter permease [Proteobacteria bacterium]|nr:tripartite tricarboxylate transporter permease [Pseudomonadota bacterium]MBU2226940.1 tripartite tricarboxylate transporter permease [Pseudomonadota bacterium]MBU2262858.1 tripartite tricarboxylate transporter permease [Pseudomonadota bacterium]
MELFNNLIFGFSVALSFQNVLYCFIGCLLGTMIGVLPGIGPMATIAMLLPITFTLPPVAALIMLAGIYYGAQYGGSTTAILVNLPGETSSVVTCIDGYQMARQGRAGPALAIAAIGSFFAGTVCTMIIAMFGPLIAEIAFKFRAPEYFSLMLMALVTAAVLSQGDTSKSLAMVSLGLLLGVVGADLNTGVQRFTFNITELADGIGFVIIAIGVFAVGEIISNLGELQERQVFTSKVESIYPTLQDLKQSIAPIIRGTAIGAFFGTLPGTGPAISSFSSYLVEKKVAKDPSRFGNGAIEGVAGPESANNAAAQCAFIPTLTLGIPGSASMALMLGALIIQGITPGPTVMTKNPDLFWGLIASMWIGNLMLLVLNLPLVGLWVSLLKVPYRLLFPAIMVFSSIGIYSLNNSPFDLYLAALFGALGFIWMRLGCPAAPMLLGFILGPLLEENLRRALLISRGDPSVFFTRPISLAFMIATVLILLTMAVPAVGKRKSSISG